MNNYDCNTIALLGPEWGINMQKKAPCSYFEDGTFAADLIASGTDQWGDTFESWLSHEKGCVSNCAATHPANSDSYSACVDACPVQTKCDCSSCLCGEQPVGAGVLAKVWSSESTTAETSWQPYGENIGKPQVSERRPTAMTPDLSRIIQEVIDLDGWAAGNSLGFVIDGVSEHDSKGDVTDTPGIPVRTYESFDGSNTQEHAWTHLNAEYGPTLSISYCAPVVCPAGHTFHSEVLRIDNRQDDVEENQAGSASKNAGFLYQGSSDLEIGNDPGTGGAQYVGLRFQNVPIPNTAKIMGASLMLTIDESFGDDPTCNPGNLNEEGCTRFNEWMTAEIKMRKVADAPEWLAGNDPDVVSNRDCSLNPDTGRIESLCVNNYDCHAMQDWSVLSDYIADNLPDGKLTSCAFFTDPAGESGFTLEGFAQSVGWDLPQYTCNCNKCSCTGMPAPFILHEAFTVEGTSESVFWSPAGENDPKCEGGCPTDADDRRVMFTSDFREVMQEVVDLPNWQQGNAMAVIIDGHPDFDNSPAVRSFESFDGTNTAEHSWTSASPAFGPTLYVSYCLPPGAVRALPPSAPPPPTPVIEVVEEKLSTGAIIGIAIGGVVAGLAVLFCGLCLLRMYASEKKGKPIFKPTEYDNGGGGGGIEAGK